MTVTSRGTSNKNVTGSAESRRRRKVYLVETYRADVDVRPEHAHGGPFGMSPLPVPLGTGVAACRCYRCGRLLTAATVEVDRIVPGCKGGTYARHNIRPACGTDAGRVGCNQITGNYERHGTHPPATHPERFRK